MLLVAVFVLGKRSCTGNFFSFFGISGTGPVQTETRGAAGFNGIDLQINADVEITIGDQYFVEVSAQQNLLPIIKTEVIDGALQIRCDENIRNSDGIRVKVTLPALDEILLGGSGKITVMNAIRAEKMEISVAGSGDVIVLQADFEKLSNSIAGSGSIELGGKVNTMNVDISGSGDVKAKSLTANSLTVSISGSGTVTADVTTNLDASISGSGDVFYSGTPSVESSVSGSGTVKKISVQ